MNIQRRPVCGALLALGFSALGAAAQPLSSRPIRIVVPFGPGGVADLTVRSVAQAMAASMGQSIVVDNKPGAGGVVAATAVATAAPDGHTLLLMSNGTAVSAGLFATLPYDTLKDFAPISTLGTFDLAVLAAANGRLASLQALIQQARARPGLLNIGTINVGSTQHLAAELLKSTLGIDVQVVPFNGTPAVVTALRGGQIDAAVEILAPVMPQVTGQALRVLAVLGGQRARALPDVPTVAQSDAAAAGLDVSSWNALAAPARTPPEVVARLNREVQAALARPALRRQLQELGVEPRGGTPAELGALLAGEIRRWSGVIDRVGIPKQ
ncbi:tripartite tricarboxylate transporter substrate-binding protein [Acidovorax sp. FG27]|uniref:Bug family tripartite tricarboxylate transporter substrate binding protein n=1 Tax=Acidovorax sp. FG27 TaxID=3133652 RepID=UPI0033408BF0